MCADEDDFKNWWQFCFGCAVQFFALFRIEVLHIDGMCYLL